DQVLDFLGRQTQRLHLHVHPHRTEVRQGLHRAITNLHEAEGPQGHGACKAQTLVLKARPDDPSHHCRRPFVRRSRTCRGATLIERCRRLRPRSTKSDSRATVIGCTPSPAARPSPSVWVSAYGVLSSGNASRLASRIRTLPKASRPMAAAKIKRRNFIM